MKLPLFAKEKDENALYGCLVASQLRKLPEKKHGERAKVPLCSSQNKEFFRYSAIQYFGDLWGFL